MKKTLAASAVAASIFVLTPAYANDGVCGPNEFNQVHVGYTKADVENVWDSSGIQVDHWFGSGSGEFIQKRYPTTLGAAAKAFATYQWNQGHWYLIDKDWCTATGCTNNA